ncbi:MAG TPA: electron transport complex subunit E, partial [Lachnospiraceae bacterium]|nr:electron transport complex subunit E [Lachnospiraceae bacterium]
MSEMNTSKKNSNVVAPLINGLLKENPTFVLMLGMCPTLAVTTSAINGMGMGLTTAAVLTMSNIIISLLRNIIPDKVRIPAFIVIIASFVTIVGQFLQAYLPALNDSLGMFIPLIVVNCIILGRAEAFASKNNPIASAFDGLGMGLGFTIALTIIGTIREMIGAHKVFGISFADIATIVHAPASVSEWLSAQSPIAIFVMAPGAFFVLAALTAIQNY